MTRCVIFGNDRAAAAAAAGDGDGDGGGAAVHVIVMWHNRASLPAWLRRLRRLRLLPPAALSGEA
jgi:hypothetical protein